MVTPRLVVISGDDSFETFWPTLAAACGVPLAVNDGTRRDADVVLNAVGNNVTADERRFVLPADEPLLKSWLRDRCRAPFIASERTKYRFEGIVGMSTTLASAAQVIPNHRAPVLLTGEPGTGKALLARAIHYEGARQSRPFVEVDCAHASHETLFGHARKPGLFELAAGGTILLNAITELPETLARVMDEDRFDVRTIAACQCDLRQWRGAEAIMLPPLRERREDIVPLTDHFVARFAMTEHLPEMNYGDLLAHDWPGNVRELRGVVERTLLLSTTPPVTLADVRTVWH